MKTAIATLALAASASAFAPVSVNTKATQLNEFANGLVGGEGPEPMFSGSKNFDPVGFTEVRSLTLLQLLRLRSFCGLIGLIIICIYVRFSIILTNVTCYLH